MNTQEIYCTVGVNCDQCKVFISTDRRGKTWYVQQGGTIVNATYDPVVNGCDLDLVYDVDSFTWNTAIEDIEEFENSLS